MAVSLLTSGRRSVEACQHKVPHHIGQRLLRPAFDRRLTAIGAENDRCIVVGPECQTIADLIHDEQVRTLACQLGPAVVQP